MTPLDRTSLLLASSHGHHGRLIFLLVVLVLLVGIVWFLVARRKRHASRSPVESSTERPDAP